MVNLPMVLKHKNKFFYTFWIVSVLLHDYFLKEKKCKCQHPTLLKTYTIRKKS